MNGRRLIAAIVKVRWIFPLVGAGVRLQRFELSKTRECIAYDPRYVRMVRINGAGVEVVPKNGGER